MNYLRIAALSLGLAGISHITIQAYDHLGMPFYLVGFIATGIIQISLAAWLWKGKLSTKLFWLTTLVNGAVTVFWLLTRLIVAPFIGGVEHFSVIGLLVVFLQLLCIILVCLSQKKLLNFILVVIMSTVIGFGAHFGAMQLEPVFPELRGTGGHHGEGHNHMSEREHSKMMDNHDEDSEELHNHNDCKDGLCEISKQKKLETENSKPKNMENIEENSKSHSH